ncbi:hypothetical protein [uncultured Mailhella sp.]|uniref:hypothetical protein n=1 Tax=uncultured Mailhella sp. TaxID=1981031 RepID=UPI003208B2E5
MAKGSAAAPHADAPGAARQVPQRPDFAATASVVEADAAPPPPFGDEENASAIGASAAFKFRGHRMQAATEDALRRVAVPRPVARLRSPSDAEISATLLFYLQMQTNVKHKVLQKQILQKQKKTGMLSA